MASAGRFPGAFQIGRVWRVHRVTFEEQVVQMARGRPLDRGADDILRRALDEARFRQEPGIAR
jgi:hypothetical protein